MNTRPVAATRLRGIWMGVTDFKQSREFYELLGAYFDATEPVDGIVSATLGWTKLIFEAGHANPTGAGPFLLFDVTDVDALHAELAAAGVTIVGPPKNEPWGRQFNVRDPDGHSIAFLGPHGEPARLAEEVERSSLPTDMSDRRIATSAAEGSASSS